MDREKIYHGKRGFTLLEVVLAVTVFAIMSVGFLSIMDKAAGFATVVQREAIMRNKINNTLDQMKTNTTIMVGTETTPADEDGIAVETLVENLYLQNRNTDLQNYYRIKITAIPPDGNKEKGLTAETYVYHP